ncbi:MAG: WG repeat-containing protein [Rikenellaceae bacterium]
MRLTISLFKDCLREPKAHLSTMADAEIIRDHSDDPSVWRMTHFAEAEVIKDGRKYMLGMPLSEQAHMICLRKVTLMNKTKSPCIPHSEILIDELKFVDKKGDEHTSDLLLHEIPDGCSLYEFAEYASRERLLEAVNLLESEFKRVGIVHNNLTPHNVVVGDNYEIYAIRYHYAEKATPEKDCSEEFVSLREWINTMVDIDGGVDDNRVVKLPSSLFSSYIHVGNPFEEMICVSDERGYLYVNTNNEVVVEGRFKWAGDFHEGRAEVETETGMGLIDKEGNFVIEPIYKIVDYDVDSGLSRVRRGEDEWALFNYKGEMILTFEKRYIDDEDLEILSI